MKVSTIDFHHACSAIINSRANEYAKTYARAGMGMFDREAIETQALYILTNLVGWRDPNAQAVKQILKGVGK